MSDMCLCPCRLVTTGAFLISVIKLESIVSKVGATEVDFVAQKSDRIHYSQVSASLMEESAFERAPAQEYQR